MDEGSFECDLDSLNGTFACIASALQARCKRVARFNRLELRGQMYNLVATVEGGSPLHVAYLIVQRLTFWWEQQLEQLKRQGFEKQAFEKNSRVYENAELKQLLRVTLNMSIQDVAKAKEGVTKLVEEEAEASQQYPTKAKVKEKPINPISGKAMMILESLIQTLEFALCEEDNYKDFKVALQRESTKNSTEWTQKFSLWCFNAAIPFQPIVAKARCVILASGTLAPFNSFASELGTQFPITLEAAMDRSKQVWAGCIERYNNVLFDGRFTSSENWEYQDALGEVIARLCVSIAHGVLCFFPSYPFLDKMLARWRSTGAIRKIESIKPLFVGSFCFSVRD
jgi:Fanconi anemia group J protein